MGIGTWVLAGCGALLLARLVHAGRMRWWLEAATALAAAILAGLAATALDFGGWKEPDWRAALFSFAVAFAALGVLRLIKFSYEGFR